MRPTAAALCLGLLVCLAAIPLATLGAADNGTIPAILLDPIAADQKNLGATVISDGFHSADEIKRAFSPGQWERCTSRARWQMIRPFTHIPIGRTFAP